MTKKTVVAKEITERAKFAARTRVAGVKKGELRKGWEAVTPELIEQVRASDAAEIESYTEQLAAGIL